MGLIVEIVGRPNENGIKKLHDVYKLFSLSRSPLRYFSPNKEFKNEFSPLYFTRTSLSTIVHHGPNNYQMNTNKNELWHWKKATGSIPKSVGYLKNINLHYVDRAMNENNDINKRLFVDFKLFRYYRSFDNIWEMYFN